jgi:hypothetical protein
MYGQIKATQHLESRRRRICTDSLDGVGQSRVHCAVAPGQGAVTGNSPSVPRGRQRANDRHAGASEAAGMVLLRHDPASQAGVVERRPDLRDGQGASSAQGVLVRRDMAEPGQAGWIRFGIRRRIHAQCVPKNCPFENAVLTPPDGVEILSIAPGDGVETLPPTPPDGAIQPILEALSTPPDGDPLDMPSLPVIQAKEVQQ